MINIHTPAENILTVLKSDPDESNEWLNYVASHHDALIYHHPAWLKVLESETGNEVIKLAARDESGKIVGILPLQVTSGMFFGLGGLAGARRISSLPRTPIAGIIADNDYAAEVLLEYAIKLTHKHKDAKLQIKTSDPAFYKSASIQVIPWRENFSIPLPEKEEEIKFGSPRNHRRIKWAINKAGNEGVTVREAESSTDINRWYKLYLETSRWHAVPPRSLKFFIELFNLIPQKNISLLFAEKDNQILAGSVLLMFNKTVFYSFNGRDKDRLNLRPNDLIQYHSIYKACRDGYSYYDMGEVADGQEGLVEFKKKWGCESRQIYHIYHSPDGPIKEDLMSDTAGNMRTNVWRKIPLGMTAKLGEIINNRL